MSPPSGTSGASSTKNGPNTVDSVEPAVAGALTATVNMERPSTSDNRMNSCRLSVVVWPTRVRKSMPRCHSASVRAADRSPMRPAHLHYKVDATGHRTLITHIFVAGDKYLASDAVFGVKNSLIVDATEHPAGTAPDGSPIDR